MLVDTDDKWVRAPMLKMVKMSTSLHLHAGDKEGEMEREKQKKVNTS